MLFQIRLVNEWPWLNIWCLRLLSKYLFEIFICCRLRKCFVFISKIAGRFEWEINDTQMWGFSEVTSTLLNYIWLYLKRTQQFQRTEAFLEVWLMLYFFKFWSAVGTTWVAENNMFLQENKASLKAKSHIISLQ